VKLHATSRVALALVVAASAAAATCGKKGPPLPPLRPVPASIPDLSAELDAGRVTLTFTIPSANSDGTTPPAIDRVEIYALTGPAPVPAPPRAGGAGTTPPAAAGTPPAALPAAPPAAPPATKPTPPGTPPASPPQTARPDAPAAGAQAGARPAAGIGVTDLVTNESRLAVIHVQLPDAPPAAAPVSMPGAAPGVLPGAAAAPQTGAGASTAPLAPGQTATYVDTLAVQAPSAGPPLARYYAVVGYAGRRRGALSAMAVVPLGRVPAAPSAVSLEFDEQAVKISWTPAAARQSFDVFELQQPSSPGAPVPAPLRLTAKPAAAAEFSTPVVFGRERCFVVRSVEVAGRASIVGESAAPACVTAVDRFPPPAPANLAAVAVDGAIELDWSAVDAPDLAGYLVLRGEGASGTLQRLTAEPVAATQYRDQSVRPGVTYVYSVVAVDKATPSNQSAQSNRQQVTARDAPAAVSGKDVR